jgi:hypothetical protein
MTFLKARLHRDKKEYVKKYKRSQIKLHYDQLKESFHREKKD